jgi:hypothetical protein
MMCACTARPNTPSRFTITSTFRKVTARLMTLTVKLAICEDKPPNFPHQPPHICSHCRHLQTRQILPPDLPALLLKLRVVHLVARH